jgi:hypothetical protein
MLGGGGSQTLQETEPPAALPEDADLVGGASLATESTIVDAPLIQLAAAAISAAVEPETPPEIKASVPPIDFVLAGPFLERRVVPVARVNIATGESTVLPVKSSKALLLTLPAVAGDKQRPTNAAEDKRVLTDTERRDVKVDEAFAQLWVERFDADRRPTVRRALFARR